MAGGVSAILELLSRLQGQLILINLHQALADRMIERKLVQAFLTNLENRVLTRAGVVSDAELFFEVNRVVWNEPSQFQLKGPDCTTSQSRIVVLKTYSNIRSLASEITDPEAQQRFHDLTAKPYDIISEEECRAIARFLNEPDAALADLHLSLITPNRNGRRFVLWYTQMDELKDLAVHMRPSNAIASRLRDQLGLGHIRISYPLFAFISKLGLSDLVVANGCKRPLVFDGIDQMWFKHRRDRSYPDNWGRTVDLEKVRLSSSAELDGAAEAVASSCKIQEHFQCVFVGRPIYSTPDLDEKFVDRFSTGLNMKVIVDDLQRADPC